MSRFYSKILCIVTLLAAAACSELPQFQGADIDYHQDNDTYIYIEDLDIPLPPELMIAEDEKALYDTPNGRIIDVFAYGLKSKQDILTFYTNSLPQLGWQQLNSATYLKDNEKLLIAVTEDLDQTMVQCSLRPAS